MSKQLTIRQTIQNILWKINPKFYDSLKKISSHRYELIFSRPGTKRYPDNEIDYTIDRYRELAEVVSSYIDKADRTGKITFLNAGSADGSLEFLLDKNAKRKRVTRKLSPEDFFQTFEYSTLEYFDQPIEELLQTGGSIFRADRQEFEKINSSNFDGYPDGFHKNHLVGDLSSSEMRVDLVNQQGYFDVVICTDVLEHLENPFEGAKNLDFFLAAGGDLIIIVPFSCYYHEDPGDYQRFTHMGILNLFKKTTNFEQYQVINIGYDITQRRENRKDPCTPVDAFGGWRELWWVYCHLKKSH
jgi:hypothetical protein